MKMKRDYTLRMTEVQKKALESLLYKVKHEYRFVYMGCPVCGNDNEYIVVATETRYRVPITNVLCKTCGLLYTNPRLREKDFFDTYNTEYPKIFRGWREDVMGHTWKALNDLGESEYEMFRKMKLISPDDKILCVGCANGGLLNAFEKHNHEARGIEIDASAVLDGIRRGVKLTCGTIKDIGSYEPDIVIYNDCMEHLVDPLQELRNIPKNAMLFIRTAGLRAIHENWLHCKFDYFLQYPHVTNFTAPTIANLLAKENWKWRYMNSFVTGVFYFDEYCNIGVQNDFADSYRYIQACKEVVDYDNLLLFENKGGKTNIKYK